MTRNPHRRVVLAAAGAFAAAPALALAKETAPVPRLFTVANAIIEAWHHQDIEGVLAHVTDDIVWQNSSGFAPPVRGKDQMRSVLKTMAGVIKENRWRIFDHAENDTRLFMEGVDEFWLTGGQHVAIPYAAVYEFRGQQVAVWREYFDGRLSLAMKAGEPVPAQVTEMISRPVAR